MRYIDEIKQQPNALRDLARHYFLSPESIQEIQSQIRQEVFSQIIFVGMGSSLYASYIASDFLREKGIRAFSMECGEFLYHDVSIVDEHTLIVVVSQSGESPEVVELCREHAVKKEWKLAIVTNYPEHTLYHYAQNRLLSLLFLQHPSLNYMQL